MRRFKNTQSLNMTWKQRNKMILKVMDVKEQYSTPENDRETISYLLVFHKLLTFS